MRINYPNNHLINHENNLIERKKKVKNEKIISYCNDHR